MVEAQASEIGPVRAVQTELGAETFRAAVEVIAMHSAVVPEGTAALTLAPAAAVVLRAWDLEVGGLVAAVVEVEVAVDVVSMQREIGEQK
jgi:hypothetical protein